jgi:hypothetical protein
MISITIIYLCIVKKTIAISILFLLQGLAPLIAFSQCSLCTKTAQQLGEKPALGLNNGIIYLMLTPLAIIGFFAYRWWKTQRFD